MMDMQPSLSTMRPSGVNCDNCGVRVRSDSKRPTCTKCRRAAGDRGQSPEAVRASQERYAAVHSERKALAAAAWRSANPEAYGACRIKSRVVRRAREKNAYVEDVSPAFVWERDGGICHICDQPADPADWHLDHVVPLARGGEHSYANTAVSHPKCNLKKGAR